MDIRRAERLRESATRRGGPSTVVWEVTRACVQPSGGHVTRPHPMELSTQEGFDLIDGLTGCGSPVLELTGGDPMMRRDLCELIERSRQNGVPCVLAPTAAVLPSSSRLTEIRAAGLRRVALGLDAPVAAPHDARATDGSWERTMALIDLGRTTGLSTQIRTTVTRINVDHLSDMAGFIEGLGVTSWRLQFLVPEGRVREAAMLTPRQHEEVLHWLHDLSLDGVSEVQVAAAPMFRRVQAQRGDGCAARPVTVADDDRRSLYITDVGDVMPFRFPPLVTGNVRRDDVVDVFGRHIIFRRLREPRYLKGKCGACEFQTVCGGERARAHALTGDPLAADPACAYVPRGYRKDAVGA